MSNSELVIVSLMMILGGIVQGASGFGFSLVVIPVLAALISPLIIIPAVLILSILINILVLIETGWSVNHRRILPIIISGCVGLPLGVILLKVIPSSVLRILIGLLIGILSSLMLVGFRYSIRRKRVASTLIGFISGVLNSSITMSGPPIILFWTNESMTKQDLRHNLALYFLVLNIATLPLYWYSGLITGDVVSFCFSQSIILVCSVSLGIFISRTIDQYVFKLITLVLVWLGSIAAIVSGIRSLRG